METDNKYQIGFLLFFLGLFFEVLSAIIFYVHFYLHMPINEVAFYIVLVASYFLFMCGSYLMSNIKEQNGDNNVLS